MHLLHISRCVAPHDRVIAIWSTEGFAVMAVQADDKGLTVAAIAAAAEEAEEQEAAPEA